LQVKSWNKKEEDWDHFLEECSFVIIQESKETHTQTPEASVQICIRDDALYVNLCPSVLTSAIFLGTDLLSQLEPPVPEDLLGKSSMTSSSSYGNKKHKSILQKSVVQGASPIVITNEYGRPIDVWWKTQHVSQVILFFLRFHALLCPFAYSDSGR
jgi:hypothetical protein